MFNKLTIRFKVIAGCFCIVSLVAVSGFVGYRGINTVGDSLHIVGSEQAPIVDMAKEMEISLIEAIVSMEEFKGASSTITTDHEEDLDDIVARYEQSIIDFDTFANAVLEGKSFDDGSIVLKTNSTELAELIRKSNQIHDEQYQVAATEMMQSGRELLFKVDQGDTAMKLMENIFDDVVADSSEVERVLSEEIAIRIEASDLGEIATAILDEDVPLIVMIMDAKMALAETRLTIEEFVQTQDLAELELIEAEYFTKVAEFDIFVGAILNGGEVNGRVVHATTRDRVRSIVEKMDEDHGEFQHASDVVMASHRDVVLTAIHVKEAMERMNAAGNEAALVIEQVEEAATIEMAIAKTDGANAKMLAINTLYVIVILSISIGLGIGFFLSRMITKPINATVDMLKDIAQGEGDLTKRLEVRSQDELGQLSIWFNTFMDRIHTIITDVSNSSTEVASAATQIAMSSDEMSKGISEQSASIMQISSAIEEMSASVVEVAHSATEATNNAHEAGQHARVGGEVVKNTVDGMGEISKAVSSSASSVIELGKKGEQIGEIIEVINDIAEQTNLLALNAAIEAARAGDRGRGFAVVADEVRKLAERTTHATEEVGQSIRDIQEETNKAVQLINTGTSRVEAGVVQANEAGTTLEKIVNSSQSLEDLISSIAQTADEQSTASSQIARGIEHINSVTLDSSRGASEAAQAADSLSREAEQLREMVGQFKI